jgi:hypothetical protein
VHFNTGGGDAGKRFSNKNKKRYFNTGRKRGKEIAVDALEQELGLRE